VDPESLQVGGRVDRVGPRQRDALDHAAEVSQVEQIVRLGRRRQEALDRLLVQRERRLHDRLDAVHELVVEAADEQVPAEDAAVDGRHLRVVELVDGDGVEVAQKARRDGVAAAARWTHRRHQLNVGQVDRRRVLQVVPDTPSSPKNYQSAEK